MAEPSIGPELPLGPELPFAICPSCQESNRLGANYCKSCGALMIQLCPRCHFDVPDAANFCDNCGLRLVESPGYSWWAVALPATALEERPMTTPLRPVRPVGSEIKAPTPISGPTPSLAPETTSHLQQYLPKELQAKLDVARASGEMVGERRVVTMLFCDVKGSTAAAERMDPEDWSEIINGAFEFMIRPVYRYEGLVARLMGDSILAFFGAPLAHEDDPQRAVLAGLDIVAGMKPYRQQIKVQHGIEFDVRVGINTGLVVVGAVGSDLRLEYTALGDAINLAARMEQTAKPGTVQIAYDSYKVVRSLFEFEALGGIEVKGKTQLVRAYRVIGRKAQTGRQRGIEGLHAEMVGREAEMLALQGIMGDLKQGVGRIVGLLGEAGLGKSRLVHETAQVFAALTGQNGNWYETGSLSYESNQAYGLFQRLIRHVNGIVHNDPPQVVRERLGPLIESLAPESQVNARQVIEALFGLEYENGGTPLEGEAFKRQLFEAMREWWRARFSDRPTVLVFDDMHWSDAASIELLRFLLPLTEEIPLVLIFALRSERQAPAWQIKSAADEEYHHRYSEISLRPLSDNESNRLIDRLLAIADLPDRLRSRILERSAGNPFFIEEVVRSLIDNGAVISEERSDDSGTGEPQRFWRATSEGAGFDIPDSLQSLLSARIDRLEEATRGTLQLASVIGRSFFHRVLQAVDEASQELDKHLSTLVRLEMIREAARVPEVEYAFYNPLTQEAVYNTILLKRRRTFHRRVAEAIEALYPDRLEGFYGLLAHHFAQAGHHERAVFYYRRASQQAVAIFAYDEAIQNLRAAQALITPAEPIVPGENSQTQMLLCEELGDVYHRLHDGAQAISLYQEALGLWRHQEKGVAPVEAQQIVSVRLNRKIVQVVTELKWSVTLENLQQANESRLAARAALEAGLRLTEGGPEHPESVRALVALSTDAWRMQEPPDWETAQRFAQGAVDMAEKLESPVDLSQALGALANVLDGRSLLREHLAVTQRRLAVSRQPQFSDTLENIEVLRNAGAAYMYIGAYQQAMPYLQEAESLAVRAQVVDQQANVLGLQAQCWFRLDRWDDVLATEVKWRALEQRYSRERVGETCFFVALSASVHALRGDFERAERYAKEAYDYMVSMSGSAEQWQRNQFY